MSNTISVLIPCYNAEKYINRCIDSILTQDYEHMRDVKIICTNDGSTDKTLAILRSYQKKLGASKFVINSQANRDLYSTRRSLLLNNKSD
jgi:glycosyltransferase involved in cell wall biosynthesis